jgi:hypothetical protein
MTLQITVKRDEASNEEFNSNQTGHDFMDTFNVFFGFFWWGAGGGVNIVMQPT